MPKIALVVGVGSGNSASFARALAADNYQVVLAARNIDKLQSLRDEIGAHAIACDATSAESVANLFASIGPDYDAWSHIIRINSYWRRRRHKRRIPKHLVIINLGHDEDCDCLDLSRFDEESGEYRIQYWCPELNEQNSWPEACANFAAYIEQFANQD